MFDAIITAKPASQKEQAFTYAAKVLRQATCRHIEERTRVHGGAVSRSDTSARIMDRYDQDALAKQKMAEKLDKARTFQIATLNDIDYIVTDDKGATHIRDTWPKGKWNVL